MYTWQMESEGNQNFLNMCHCDRCDLYLRKKISPKTVKLPDP